MTGTFVAPVQGKEVSWLERYQIYAALTGKSEWGRIITITSLDDDSNYAVTIRNRGTGGALNVQGSGGTSVLQVIDSGTVVTGSLAVSTAITAGTTVTASRLISTVAIGTAPLTVTSTTLVTNLNADLLDGLHAASFVLRAGDTMTGALTIEMGGAGNDQALKLKHNSGVGGFWLGASNAADPVLIFKDDSGDQTFEVGNSASTYQARVIGDLNVTQNIEITSGSLLAQTAEFLDNVTISDGTFIVEDSGNSRLEIGSTGIGFFGSAQVAKPTVVGSRAGNAALNSLLSELANLGLVTNSTTA